MKKLFLMLIAILLLCGCTKQQVQDTIPAATPPETTQQETTAPPTEAPNILLSLLDSMTIEEMVGQLFLARCPAENALKDINSYHLGGYILFARDFEGESPDSIQKKLSDYQAASKIPMLLAVDEEGGIVCRVSRYEAFRSQRFRSPRSLYDEGGMELVLETEQEKALLLQSLGINVNMAPVCDITTDPDAFMYSRSLGQSPEITGDFVSETAKIMLSHHVGAVLKHFPGYGNNTDTHVGIAIDERSLEELEISDLVPFLTGIRSGCGAIMVSHTFINCLDDQYPATLSPAVHEYLRTNMKFEGVIVTDDLVMQAITDLYGSEEAAVLAVLAGNDLLCVSDYAVQYHAVLEAVNVGRISQEQLRQSVLRILRWKERLGLIQ